MTSTLSGCLLEPATGFTGLSTTMALLLGFVCAFAASDNQLSSVYCSKVPEDGAVVDSTALTGCGGGRVTCLAAAHFAALFHVLPVMAFSNCLLAMWGLLKVFLPKACVQRSLCRWSIAQSFEATAELGLWQRVNLTNKKECDVWCDCDRDCDLTFWTWLDVCWVLDFLELALT